MKVAVALALAATLALANIPMTLVSEDEAEPIHSAIVRKEAWTVDSVRRLRADADRRLKEGPWSVTAERPNAAGLDPHEYYSEAPFYWPNPDSPDGPYIRKDGQANPARYRANRLAMVAMSDALFSLGAASFLLDNPAYGQRAALIVRAWFLNPKTRMNPGLDYAQSVPGVNNGRGAGITDGRPLLRAIQGMEFLAQTGSWDAKEQAAVRKWFEDYLHWLLESKNAGDEKKSGDDHTSWWAAQVAGVASFVEDAKAQQMAFNFYRSAIFPRQIRPNGSAPREEDRTGSLQLSAFNLEAFTTICRMAQVHGTDLWGLRARNGATLATAADYLAPFLEDPRKWTREQSSETPIPNDTLSFLAFAGMGLKKSDYLTLYRKLARPDSAWINVVDLMVSRFEAAGHQTRH